MSSRPLQLLCLSDPRGLSAVTVTEEVERTALQLERAETSIEIVLVRGWSQNPVRAVECMGSHRRGQGQRVPQRAQGTATRHPPRSHER